MEIKYDLNVEDILQLNLFRLEHIPSLRKRQIITRWGYLAVTLLIVVVAYSLGVSVSMVVLLAIISILFFIFFPKNTEWQIRRMVAKLYKDPARQESLLERSMKLSAKQLETTSNSGNHTYDWKDLDVVSIGEDRTMMSFQDGTCLVVPRERLQPGSDYQAFTRDLRSHIPQEGSDSSLESNS